MKSKTTSLLIASILAANSFAFAESATSKLESLRKAPAQKTLNSSQNRMTLDLVDIVADATDIKKADLIATRTKLLEIIKTMESIKNDNEKDEFLKMANSLQTGLALVSSVSLAAHLSSTEHRKITLTISAASALISSMTRVYKQRSSLQATDVSQVLSDFTSELLASGKGFSPEVQDLIKEVSEMNNLVIKSKGILQTTIDGSGNLSYVTTLVTIGMAITHWVSPKMAVEAEVILKDVSLKTGQVIKGLGEFSGKATKTTGAATAGSVLPDLVGNIMGLNTENSQRLITTTVNDLTKAAMNFQSQIDAITNYSK
jgi:hypothetical protein